MKSRIRTNLSIRDRIPRLVKTAESLEKKEPHQAFLLYDGASKGGSSIATCKAGLLYTRVMEDFSLAKIGLSSLYLAKGYIELDGEVNKKTADVLCIGCHYEGKASKLWLFRNSRGEP